MVITSQKIHNPLKPLYTGACRFLRNKDRVLVYGFFYFVRVWNYKCGLYLTQYYGNN
jgi:hypothetical protein